MMTKRVVSVADRAVELNFPSELSDSLELLFGQGTPIPLKLPDHTIDVAETGSDRYAVHVDLRRVGEDYSAAELIEVLLDETVRCLIHDLDVAVALHSASVGWQDKSILIAGPSGSGKTSVAGWFVSKGFDFLSDEIVLLPGEQRTTISFPRSLLAKPGADELIALLADTGQGRAIPAGSNTLISLGPASVRGNQRRRAGLVIFPNFVAGGELGVESVTAAAAVAKLMGCNLNARNLADHGLRTTTTFCRNVPALALTYGSFDQLDGVADAIARFALEGDLTVHGLRKFVTAFAGTRPSAPAREAPAIPFAGRGIPEATPRKGRRKLTIGMATFDDYDGTYFSLQAIRLYHPEILDDIELLVIDNNPRGRCGEPLKALENAIPNYRYVPASGISGTAIRDSVFEEASGDFVLCMDCHVFIAPGALQRLIAYCDANPGSNDLLQGPLVHDDLTNIATHMRPEWRAGMYGIWSKTPLALDIDAPPFEIGMQGLGVFACRREAWPGFNPLFRGFGGEEGYIHEKFRRRGGRVLCLPYLRWMHRFNRPMGVPYPNRWEDRVRNYFIGFRELGWNTAPIAAHFKTVVTGEAGERLVAEAEEAVRADPPVLEPAASDKPAALPERHGNTSASWAFNSIWDPPAKTQQLALLRRVLAAAEAHDLALYLFWGTLLGHVRENGMLPWDDDVDLAVFDPGHDRLAAFRAALDAEGLQTFDRAQGPDVWIKICDPTAPIQSHGFPWTWPFIDIFIYSCDPDANDACWPALRYPRNLVMPGRLTQFEGLRCWEPEQPQSLLDLQYEGWRDRERSSDWNHRWETPAKAVSIRSILTDARGRKLAEQPATHENPLAQDVFLPLLRAWIDLSRKYDIPYSIYWGTLLGQLRNQRLIPYDRDVDVVVGRSGMEILHGLPGRAGGCMFNDELKSQPAWRDHEIRLVVRRDLDSCNGPRFDRHGEAVATQVDSCSFNGPMARLVIKLPGGAINREYWHLDVDLFTHISRFNPYPVRDDVDELPELEDRPLEDLVVSCLKDPLPYIVRYYGADYLTPDHSYRDGDWIAHD